MFPADAFVQCLGYGSHGCDTLIVTEANRSRCHFCQRSLDLDIQRIREPLEPAVILCDCGGLADASEHVLTLGHRRWVYNAGGPRGTRH
jgi:hypothetical protein